MAHAKLSMAAVAPHFGKADSGESYASAQWALDETKRGVMVYVFQPDAPIFQDSLLQRPVGSQGSQSLGFG